MGKSSKKDHQNDSSLAYTDAQRKVKDLEEGYIPYDRIFTSIKTVKSSFYDIIGGDLLQFFGYAFFWRREKSGPLLLYGQDLRHALKEKGLVELCRLRVPEEWIGTGTYRIDYPKENSKDSNSLLLVSLYLYSTDVGELAKLISTTEVCEPYLATLFFNRENSALFYDLTEKRFVSLK